MEHKDVFLLETIVEFCDRIINNTDSPDMTCDFFENNLDLIDQCAFRIEQIGENAKDLSDVFKDNSPEIEWGKIVAFRNIIAHAYGTVNAKILWDIVRNDIPELRKFCAEKIGIE